MNKKLNGSRKFIFISFGIVLMIVLGMGIILLHEKKPIKIGFLGTLVGKYSEWGVGGRDGFMLAVSHVNETGGLNGHQIEVIIKDDSQYQGRLELAFEELINEDVVTIVGPALTAVAVEAVPIANNKKMLLLSYSASGELLSGKDDYFVRSIQTNRQMAELFSKYIFETAGWKKIVSAYDTTQRVYSEDWYNAFKNHYESLGGRITLVKTFDSLSNFKDIAENLGAQKADGIFIVAYSIHAAIICQELRKTASKLPIAVNSGAADRNFMQHGGTAVEGVIFPMEYYAELKTNQFINYKKLVKERLGIGASREITLGYDTGKVLIKALKNSNEWTPDALKKTIIKIGKFTGPQGYIKIDKFGDATREVKIITIKNGKFVRIF